MANNYENELLNTITQLVDRGINLAKYDTTVMGTIVAIEDEEKGIYKVKYQDNTFTAYTVIPGMDYPLNSIVYVLIPNNDFNEDDKIILWGKDASAVYSRALPVCMITVQSDNEYDITTRRGVEKYIAATAEVPVEEEEGE